MISFSHEKIGKTAREIADHLMLVENVKALQQAQKEMANAIAALGDRIRKMETDMRAVKAEAKFEAIKEAQQMLNSVQGAFHDKLTDLTVRIVQVERLEHSRSPLIALSKLAAPSGDGEIPPA
jgi:predicted  nucleic acid-binding Zn-ribbon protein